MRKIITLTHYLQGPMRVSIAEDATFWCGHRQWSDDDSDGALYDEGDFEETPAEIERLLMAEAQ
jgi:hypothetical protein